MVYFGIRINYIKVIICIHENIIVGDQSINR